MLDNSGDRYTVIIIVITAFPRKTWLLERTSILLFTYFAVLFISRDIFKLNTLYLIRFVILNSERCTLKTSLLSGALYTKLQSKRTLFINQEEFIPIFFLYLQLEQV
jgi:hypothetical protein